MGGMRCCYHGCKNDRRKFRPGNVENIYFMSFPKPSKNLEKCQRWITASCLPENCGSFLKNIDRNTYICSKHFIGGHGPIKEHPDPIPLFPEKYLPTANVQSLDAIKAPVGWLLERTTDGNHIFYKKRKERIILSFEVAMDLNFYLTVLSIPATDEMLNTLPKIETLQDIVPFLNSLDQKTICLGNQEEKFVKAFLKSTKRTKARYCEVTKSVYSIHCKQFSKQIRCSSCSLYRNALRCFANRIKKQTETLNSMSPKQLIAKLKMVEEKNRQLLRQIKESNKTSGNNDTWGLSINFVGSSVDE